MHDANFILVLYVYYNNSGILLYCFGGDRNYLLNRKIGNFGGKREEIND